MIERYGAMIKECIYSQQYSGKWYRFFCCHTWENLYIIKQGQLTIEQNRCIECGRMENMILVNWVKEER